MFCIRCFPIPEQVFAVIGLRLSNWPACVAIFSLMEQDHEILFLFMVLFLKNKH